MNKVFYALWGLSVICACTIIAGIVVVSAEIARDNLMRCAVCGKDMPFASDEYSRALHTNRNAVR